jgi:hypothetical protein
VNGAIQASELDQGTPIEESTVTELAAPPATDETCASSLVISENPVKPEDPHDSSEESVGEMQTGIAGHVADQSLIGELESEAPPPPQPTAA